MIGDPPPQPFTQQVAKIPVSLQRTNQLPFDSGEITKPTRLIPVVPDDAETALPEEMLPPNELYITQQLEAGVAILHVYENGAEQYQVWGRGANLPLKTDAKPYPNLILGNMVRCHFHSQVEMPEDIQGLMGEFSFSNPEICRWLQALREQFDDQSYLIIADYTDAEIPWELLELSLNQYLGAVVTTVRWQHILQTDHQNCFMEVKSEECCGKVLAYVNREELRSATLELDVLETLHSLIHQDIRIFQDHLKQELTDFGLVYLACHGIFEQDIRSFAFGAKSDRTQQIKFMEFRRLTLMLLKVSPSIVFINACHSGRLQMDRSYVRDRYRRGFAELFLGKGARGVIGTLGEVGDDFAAQFARNLLEETLRSPHLPVAAILKNLRAKVVANLPDQPTTEDLLPFIYTFMYVYYGNPMTVLRLNQRGADSNG